MRLQQLSRKVAATLVLAGLAMILAGCGAPAEQQQGGLSGSIQIDGSSTVFPITEAVAEEFRTIGPEVRVTVGVSGTGGGFKKFLRKEIEICNASRPIKPSEQEEAVKSEVEFIELPVAYDGLAVVVNPQNDWADALTVEELKLIWSPEAQGRITNWSQVRAGFPDVPLSLFGPGVDSGTYDYFTQAVVGKEGSSRGDFTASEDDNVLVQGVSFDKGALGFFGYAYFEENRNRLKLVPIDDGNPDNGDGPIAPSPEAVRNSTYQPLSRPIFIYVRKDAAGREEVQSFIEFYLDNATTLVPEVGYIPLPDKAYDLLLGRFQQGIPGSIFGGEGSQVGVSIEELLSREG